MEKGDSHKSIQPAKDPRDYDDDFLINFFAAVLGSQ